MTDVDVLVVGGGPAGLSTAIFLAHLRPKLRGRLLVVEKEKYPREKPCAGAVGGRAEAALGRIGIDVDVPGAVVRGISLAMPQGRIEAREKRAIGRVVRRIEFDHRLAEIARGRGIRVEDGVRVASIANDGERVRVETSAGEIRARVVVGADGVGSIVRRSLGIRGATWRAQALEVDTERTERDGAADILHFDVSDHALDGYEWDFATIVNGHELVCRGVYHLVVPGKDASSVDLNLRLAARLERFGLDLAKCKKKRYAERGFAPHEPIARPRVILVGEAAGIDPITGEGIAQAILYGEAVAPYLLARLDSGDLSFADWPSSLATTTLGVDMRARHFLCRHFFGPARTFYERSFVETPAGLEEGIRYFGGIPMTTKGSLEVAASVVKRLWLYRDLEPWRSLAI